MPTTSAKRPTRLLPPHILPNSHLHSTAARRDLALLVVFGVVVTILAQHFNLFRYIVRWGRRLDELGGDALLAAMPVFIVGLMIYAWRRWQELRRAIDIRVRAEVTLRASEARYRAVVGQVTEGIFLFDAESKRIVETNPSIRALLGYNRDELAARTLYDIIANDRASIEENVGRIVAGRYAPIGERDYRRKNGTTVPVEVSAVALTDGAASLLCAVVRDTTARRVAEDALRASEARLQVIVQNVPVILFTLDAAGVLTFAAGRGLVTLGLTPRAIVGRSVFDDDAALRGMEQGSRRALNGETLEERVPIGDFLFAVHFAPLHDADNAITGVIGVATNITARTRAEAERDHARRLLAKSREDERLRLAWELHDGPVQQLLGVRHHLAAVERQVARTPAAVALSPALVEVEAHIVTVARELRHMIRALRPTGLVERGLPAVLEEYVAEMRQEGVENDAEITLSLDLADAQIPPAIGRLLLRVAQESLRNAIRHSNAQQIALSLQVTTTWAELTVTDDGRGLTLPPDLSSFANSGHFGLVGLQEEIDLACGYFLLEAQPGAGMTVQARLPLGTQERDNEDDPYPSGR